MFWGMLFPQYALTEDMYRVTDAGQTIQEKDPAADYARISAAQPGEVRLHFSLLEKLDESARVIKMDALKMAEEAGEARADNLVLLGALCRDMGSDKEAWEKAIAACVKEKLLAVNLKAFEMGYNY